MIYYKNKKESQKSFTVELYDDDFSEKHISEILVEMIDDAKMSKIQQPIDRFKLNDKVIYLDYFFTVKDLRDNGYGELLFEYVLNTFIPNVINKNKKYKQIILKAEPYDSDNRINDKARLIKMYKYHGFKIYKTDTFSDTWMYKKI